jgi:hypothetical protein
LQGKLDNARAQQITQDAENAKTQGDWRVRLSLAPGASYLYKAQNPGILEPLQKTDGVIFPYTPSISYDNKADYAAVNPTHSNYTQHFYKYSSVTDINIIGKFTVQNETDAYILLSTLHLLKALTKMRAGGETNSGAPPPVCRLYAYGQQMLDETPIVIKTLRIDLPEGVDYFTVNKTGSADKASVPMSCTITLGCAVVYSRNEIQNFTVQNWLAVGRTKGYL